MTVVHSKRKKLNCIFIFFQVIILVVFALSLREIIQLSCDQMLMGKTASKEQISDAEEGRPIRAVQVLDPDATDCLELLAKFRANEIEATKAVGNKDYHSSVVAVTNTSKQFYVSTHSESIDPYRARISKEKEYYERQLTRRVVDIYNEKVAKGEKSMFLDVGGNIGWFSLLAAAYGASKVYYFEPNLQNVVRFCESLNLNHWLRDDRNKDVLIPIRKGVGNTHGKKMNMYSGNFANEGNPGAYSFARGNEMNHATAVGEIEITTLDYFAESHGWFESKPSIGMFKLDVELFERYVLEGAEKLLRSNIIETIAMELQESHSREDKSKILSILYDAGYEMYMHGSFFGPHLKIKKHSSWEELLTDLDDGVIGVNAMFRLKSSNDNKGNGEAPLNK